MSSLVDKPASDELVAVGESELVSCSIENKQLSNVEHELG
jgi:hypothetical protein